MFKNKSVQSVVNKVTARVAPVAGYTVKGAGALARATTPVGNMSNAGKSAGKALRGAISSAESIKRLKKKYPKI